MKRDPSIHVLVLLLSILAIWGCTERPPDEPALVQIDDRAITVEAFEEAMRRGEERNPGRYFDPESRAELLEEMIDHESLFARAEASGHADDPELVAAFRRSVIAKFREDQLAERLQQIDVSDAEVRRYYDEHLDRFLVPERRRMAWVWLRSNPKASPPPAAEGQALRARAEQVRVEALELDTKVQNFGALALRYSDDRATRPIGGDVGWVVRGRESYRWDPAVIEALFAIDAPGGVSPVIDTPDGVALVKMVDRRSAEARPMDQVAATIRNELIAARRNEIERSFVEEQRARTRIEIDYDLLNRVPPPANEDSATKHPVIAPSSIATPSPVADPSRAGG